MSSRGKQFRTFPRENNADTRIPAAGHEENERGAQEKSGQGVQEGGQEGLGFCGGLPYRPQKMEMLPRKSEGDIQLAEVGEGESKRVCLIDPDLFLRPRPQYEDLLCQRTSSVAMFTGGAP